MSDFDNLETLLVEIDDFTAFITLNRPAARNAMNFKMVEEITSVFESLRDNRDVRCVVLSGADGTFCAGGDIKEMREKTVPNGDSRINLDVMLRTVNQSAQVVIAKVEGAALGGGLGLVCVSDIAIASDNAQFGMPEVRLGVSPAFISPFVLQRMGLTRTRELMLTGRRFGSQLALDYSLVHMTCAPQDIDDCVQVQLNDIRLCAPRAIAATKDLIFTVLENSLGDTVEYRANLLNTLRSGEEAQEGMKAFLEKRPAAWVKKERDT
ncbi:MAG: enoyl-CoA hydratase-related protein [Anaerolineae bacterium]|nr:enoyl-CoA hydratase-related protein [Anaerolineae bacterium]